MSSSDESSSTSASNKKYIGVRRRKWGKWVSEIRVPGTQDRLWLGSYSTPEAAAVAHDVASYCLRGPPSVEKLNFPLALPVGARTGLSPRSVQKAASDAGMAVDAHFSIELSSGSHNMGLSVNNSTQGVEYANWRSGEVKEEDLNISVDDYL